VVSHQAKQVQKNASNIILKSLPTRPNIGVQVMPLARPVTRGVGHARSVPSAVAFKEAASGALEAQRWAAKVCLSYD